MLPYYLNKVFKIKFAKIIKKQLQLNKNSVTILNIQKVL